VEWMRIQNNTSCSTEQPAANSSIVLTEGDQIPHVIRATEERLAKKRGYTVRIILNRVLLTDIKLLQSARTSRSQIANLKKPSLTLAHFSLAFLRLNTVLARRLSIVKSLGYFRTSHTSSSRMQSAWRRTGRLHLRHQHSPDSLLRLRHSLTKSPQDFSMNSQLISLLWPKPLADSTTVSFRELKWKFSLYMKDRQMTDASCSYKPSSDLSMISKRHRCPYMIAEVVSNKDTSDRYRMLLQATAAARVGRYLMKSSARPFVLMGIYLTKDLVAERYLVCQAGKDNKVCQFAEGSCPELTHCGIR
jgi:hypothetical protein